MNRRSYRILGLVAQALLALLVAASTSSAQSADQLDHFLCYIISSETPQPSTPASLIDQFFVTPGVSVKVGSPLQFCNPLIQKNGENVFMDSTHHLTMYRLQKSPTLPAPQTLTATPTNTLFGPQTLTVGKASSLMVPTAKNITTIPDVNHFLCYPVSGKSLAQTVTLTDEFRNQQSVIVEAPTLFCNPVAKTIGGTTTDVTNPDAHLLCYNIRLPKSTNAREIGIQNQLETGTFTVTSTPELCVPSTKAVVP